MAHFSPCDLLLPDFSRCDGSRYPVIACDQFTSEPAFWEETAALVGDNPSTLSMILPELYLANRAERIPGIHRAMREYRKSLFVSYPETVIYLRRVTSSGAVRQGLIGKIDLEDYDYRPGCRPLIRATEGTVTERIPPRLDIRRGAPLELPHIMLLLDDPGRTVIETCEKETVGETPLYDISLLQGGGRVTGYALGKAAKTRLLAALTELEESETAAHPDAPMLYAVGDGNHSLASAKAYYEELKASLGEAAKNHPARYAMAELCNLHDDALDFHPIYRAVFGADGRDLVEAMMRDAAAAQYADNTTDEQAQTVTVLTGNGTCRITYRRGTHSLTVGTVQRFLDGYLAEHPGVRCDYIHGEDPLASLVRDAGAVGFLFDGMGKEDLFPAVRRDGALPRKTFSMGEALDKRYYLEARELQHEEA